MLLAILKLHQDSVCHGVCEKLVGSLALGLALSLLVETEGSLNTLKLVLELLAQV